MCHETTCKVRRMTSYKAGRRRGLCRPLCLRNFPPYNLHRQSAIDLTFVMLSLATCTMSRSIIADDRDQNTQQLNRFRKGSFHWIRLAIPQEDRRYPHIESNLSIRGRVQCFDI